MHWLGRAEARVEAHLRSTPKLAAGIFLATCAVLALRLPQALDVPGVGGDYGHYLIGANWLAGTDRSGEGPFDPPLVPLLTLILAPIVGKIAALQILGPAATAFLVPAAFPFFERLAPRWAALTGSVLLAAWPSFTELTAFGGVTNVFGIAFSVLFFRFFLDALSSPTAGWKPRRAEVLAASFLFLVLTAHHLSAFMTGCATLLWVAVALARPPGARRAVLATAARVVVPTAAAGLVYLPYLLSLLPAEFVSGLGSPVDAPTFTSGLAYSLRYSPIVAAAMVAAAAVGAVRLRLQDPRAPALAAIAATPFLLLFTILATHPFRPFYFVPVPLIALALLSVAPTGDTRLRAPLGPRLQPVGRMLLSALVASALVVTAAGTPALTRETHTYYQSYWTPDTTQALEWVATQTPSNAVVAVDGATAPDFNHNWQATSLGWLVEGYANRRAVYEGHPPLIPFVTKWPDVRAANRLFSGESVFEDGVLRVADNFPLDDWAGPRISTGYFEDYHEFVGLAAPRLVDSANGTLWWIISSADRSAAPRIDGTRGLLVGNYSGPDFSGTRSMAFDGANHTVSLTTTLSLQPGAPWDLFEMGLLLPPWTAADLGGLSSGVVALDVPMTAPYNEETAQLRFVGSNLSAPVARVGSSVQGSEGFELTWATGARTFSLTATLTLDAPPSRGPGPHPMLLSTPQSIVADFGITHILVSGASFHTMRRLGLQPALYELLFANNDYAIFRVVGTT